MMSALGSIFDWRSFRWAPADQKIRFESYISEPQFTMADGRVVDSAYDPTIVESNGERLIAFECHGPRDLVVVSVPVWEPSMLKDESCPRAPLC